ncbi:MAG TPA: HAD-IA family hydrolase [Chthoniobacterales bacterium]|nr:HAD-IA family hydrolase [Chthoniobacterales bacterium]
MIIEPLTPMADGSNMQTNLTNLRPQLVLFDIGGVVIDLDLRDARTTLESEYLMAPETFLELTRSGFNGEVLSVTEKAMIGAIGTQEYLLAFQSGCKRPIAPEAARRLRESMLGPERPEMLEFLEQLSRHIPIAAFTNTIALHWDILTNPKRYRFPQLFPTIFASHLIGDAKPRIESFKKVLSALGVSPKEVVFIDDSELNVSGAAQLGIKGIVFKNLATLREELGKYLDL